MKITPNFLKMKIQMPIGQPLQFSDRQSCYMSATCVGLLVVWRGYYRDETPCILFLFSLVISKTQVIYFAAYHLESLKFGHIWVGMSLSQISVVSIFQKSAPYVNWEERYWYFSPFWPWKKVCCSHNSSLNLAIKLKSRTQI